MAQPVAAQGTADAAAERALQNFLASDEMGFFRQEIPTEYEAIVPRVTEIYRSEGTLEERHARAAEEVYAYRKRYDRLAAAAPDENMREVLAALREMYAEVLRRDGPRLCFELIAKGTDALPDREKYNREINRMTLAVLRAAAGAQTAPVEHGAAQVGDWGKLGEVEGFRNMQPEVRAALDQPDGSNPHLCDAAIVMTDAMIELPGESGRRVRSSFLKDMAK